MVHDFTFLLQRGCELCSSWLLHHK